MPQGKGTYGSQVGRPPKKKYNKGGNVDPFSTRNPVGVPAEQMAEAMEKQAMANEGQEGQEGQEGLPTSNAQDRSQMSPDVEQYNKGGKVKSKKVDITDIVKEVGEWETLQQQKDISNAERASIQEAKYRKVGKFSKKALKGKKK